MTYSAAFLEDLKEYIGTADLDIEAYTRVDWGAGFFDQFKPHMDLDGKTFLDAGCGHGVLCLAAHREGMIVSGFDYETKAVDLANARFHEEGASLEAFQHDLRQEIPQGFSERFDVVASYQVLEHMPRADQFTAIRRLCEMVKPGGLLFIDTENLLYPHDRHDTGLPLVRLLSPVIQKAIVARLGKGIDVFEASHGERVMLHDYLSFDEVIGATQVLGLDLVNAVIPHGTARQRFLSMTGSDWFYDTIAQYFESERFMPVTALFRKR